MKAEPLSVGKVLSENQRFVVPIYQRTYTWTEKNQLDKLWEQIENKADELFEKGKTAFPHYMGSLLVIPEGEATFGQVQAYDVVDGQQRITTFHLLFAALRAIAREANFADLAKNIEALLLIPEDSASSTSLPGRYKLQPTKQDRKIFQNLVDFDSAKVLQTHDEYFYANQKLKKQKAPRTLAAYCFFYERVWSYLDVDPLRTRDRFKAINEVVYQSFRFIVITLSKDDDPQVIFETLNTGGEPLAAMDLVRNDIFLRAARGKEDADFLMENYWSVFENDFWKETRTQGRLKKPTMDFFLTHALGAETGKFVSPSEVYSEYRSYSRALVETSVEDELTKLIKYVKPYRVLAAPSAESRLDRLAYLLEVFDSSTAYPAILLIATAQIEDKVKERLYELIGSYIVRRALCGLTAKNYNIVFSDLCSYFKTADVSEDAFAVLMETKKNNDSNKFPTNQELRESVVERNQYSLPTNRLRFILSELEIASRDKFTATADLKPGLWVEHLMPQSWRTNWPLLSGRDTPPADAVFIESVVAEEMKSREKAIQTLGNLTLLTPASNASAGYASFKDKKTRLLGSLTVMNAKLANLEKWDEIDILSRSKELAEAVCQLWQYPVRAGVQE